MAKKSEKICALIFILGLSIPSGLLGDEQEVRNVFTPTIAPPTRVQPTQEGEQAVIQANLEGISIGARGSFAVINGQVYDLGEEKGGIKVTQIRKREVDILINNIPSTLYMIAREGAASSGDDRGVGTPSEPSGRSAPQTLGMEPEGEA